MFNSIKLRYEIVDLRNGWYQEFILIRNTCMISFLLLRERRCNEEWQTGTCESSNATVGSPCVQSLYIISRFVFIRLWNKETCSAHCHTNIK